MPTHKINWIFRLLTMSFLLNLPFKLSAQPLFQLGNKTFTHKELSPATQQALYESKLKNYHRTQNIINSYLIDLYYKQEAKKLKKPLNEVKKKHWDKVKVTPQEVEKWYKQNQFRLGGRDLKSISHEIQHHLENEKRKEYTDQLVTNYKKKENFTLKMSVPTAPSFQINISGYPVLGPDNAKVTIVEFADYQCPHCKMASEQVKKVLTKYKSQVKLIYLDYPINRSGISTKVAMGAYCANAQNKFWEFHTMAFKNQANLSNKSPEEYAKNLKLNLSKFNECMNSEKAKNHIQLSKEEGDRVGVSGTPTFFINGKKHIHESGSIEESLTKAIKTIL